MFKNKKIIIIPILLVFILVGGLIFLLYPSISLKGEENIVLNLNDEYKESGYIAKSTLKNISNKVKISGKVESDKIGKYEIVYSVKEGPFKKKVKRVVEVKDQVLPVIQLKGKESATICPNASYKEEGYTALDNYDGDITDKVEVVTNEDSILYSVLDSSGNKASITRKIVKEDKEAPKIKLSGSTTKYVYINSSYNDDGYTVSDNCDTDLKSKVSTTGTVNTKKAGTYEIKYEVMDASGNKASAVRKVVVYAKSSAGNTSGKKGTIYLTFDDGPSSSITPGILKILKAKNVKATFFVINHSSSLDYLIKQEHNEGHTVALHSYTHDYKTIYSSSTAYFNDLNKISDKVKKLTGVESKIIRFPGGSSNTVSRKYSKGIMTYLSNEVIARGYHYFDWNVGSGDAGDYDTKAQVYRSVVSGLSKSKANVVLMHDFENNYKTLNALSDIIDYGLANGYTFSAIDMNTPLVRHNVNN